LYVYILFNDIVVVGVQTVNRRDIFGKNSANPLTAGFKTPALLLEGVEQIELLLPAGDKDSLRAAVANGADAVYLGLESFNARRFAENFRKGTLPSIVEFCHKKDVRVFVTANILVKNNELENYFNLVNVIGKSGADAVIIQDSNLIPLVKETAPGCEIHLSTQAAIANRYAIPEGADRVIVPRELSLEQISAMAKIAPIEMFAHGALCLSYSGQCLFSSIAGARSGNRGKCAQPCRHRYNGTYPLSTMDLCLLEKIPDIIKTGIVALKVEGRMRGPLYTGAVARIYRKYIDMHYSSDFKIDPRDIEELKMAFNREFTTGFAFNRSIVDSTFSMNRGIYLGIIDGGKICLESDLRTGDGVMAIRDGNKTGNTINKIKKENVYVDIAGKGDVVNIEVKGARNGDKIFKTFSSEFQVDLGEDFVIQDNKIPAYSFKMPKSQEKKVTGSPSLFVKVHDAQGAREANDSGASVIYYDIFSEGCESARQNVKNARFFLSAPRIMSDADVEKAMDIIKRLKPDGVMAGERGILSALKKSGTQIDMHLDQSFNIFNDIDLGAYEEVPIISQELTFEEISKFRSKRFMVMVHGSLVLMTTREPITDRVLTDESSRRFRTRKSGDMVEILNCSDLGLFNMVKDYLGIGVKWFYLDPARDVGKTVSIYKKIISGEPFDDRKIRRGFTTGHFRRGVD
jgi:collagenase-like PrtC family protease